MARIFISYRRDDSAYPAQMIHKDLTNHFGFESVVFDVDTIPPGVNFREYLNKQVSKCDILLAVIGDQWIDILNKRRNEPDDFVRIEIQAALERQIPVVPILVGKATVPSGKILPPELVELSNKQAVEVRAGADLPAHIKRLINGLDRLLAEQRAEKERKQREAEEERKRKTIEKTSSKWFKAGQDESYSYRSVRLAIPKPLQRGFFASFLTVLIIFATVLMYQGFSARNMPDLEPWLTIPKLEDNLTQASYNDFSEYLAAENQFLATIQKDVTINETSSFNRYARNNKSSPYVDGYNLNASFEFMPDKEKIKGGVLLVHGVTDSPYYLRAIGRVFSDNGFYVIGLRLPGTGTVPGGLLRVTWEDWYSAVKFGARMVSKKIKNLVSGKFYVCGFSAGGALTLRYFLETTFEKPKDSSIGSHRVPDKLLLLSPVISVSPFAEVIKWHKMISWMPWFKKFKWIEISPEYDPFKYNSFATNAGAQIYGLTKANQKLIEEIAQNENIKEKLHPIYAFHSSVDATAKAGNLLEMYKKIASKESELILFDINRSVEILKSEDVNIDNLLHSEKIKNMVATIWVISNKPTADGHGYEAGVAIKMVSELSEKVSMTEREFGRYISLEWPENVFALSHICIPISPDDRFYGRNSKLGKINAKGERGELLVTDNLARLRYNPFFELIKEHLVVSFLRSTEYHK